MKNKPKNPNSKQHKTIQHREGWWICGDCHSKSPCNTDFNEHLGLMILYKCPVCLKIKKCVKCNKMVPPRYVRPKKVKT